VINKVLKPKVLRLIVAILLVLLVTLMVLPVTPVYAIADPDSPPQISAVFVYEDCLEDGDVGVLIDYYLDYAAIPSEVVTLSYLAVFVDVDGSTQLKTVAPYTFVDSGYGRGLVWIYFTAAEVDTYSIDQANEALYKVWLMGNPTVVSGWAGDPPKTIAGIDYWQDPGGGAVLSHGIYGVLYYADILELAWSLDMIEVTALGNRLTSTGESYFENVITNLRDMAPAAFAVSEIEPTIEELDYKTLFGVTMTDGPAPTGGTVTGSPIIFINSYTGIADAGSSNVKIIDAELTQEDDYWNLASLVITSTTDGLAPEGEIATITDFIAATDELQFAALSVAVNTGDTYTVAGSSHIVTITANGIFVLELSNGTAGTVTDGTGVVTGSPVDIVAGTNTITTTGIGTLTVDAELQDTTTAMEDVVAGTGFDLTNVATHFGMSRWFFSGMVWLIMSVIICAATYHSTPERGFGGTGAGKIVMIVFNICIIGGTLLGLLKPVVAVGMFLAFGTFTGYMLFFKGAHF